MSDRVRQGHARIRGPLLLDDMQIGPADAGAADPDHHVERVLDRGSGTSSITGCW